MPVATMVKRDRAFDTITFCKASDPRLVPFLKDIRRSERILRKRNRLPGVDIAENLSGRDFKPL